MTKKSLILPAVIGSLLLSPGMTLAKPSGDHSAHGFISKLDSNKDGAISSEEFNANLVGNFSKKDKNGNGTIDLAEFSQHGKERRAEYEKKKKARKAEKRAERFKVLDSNADGFVSAVEYISAATSRAEERFSKLDGADQDGKISLQEYSQKRSHGDKQGKPTSKMKNRRSHPSAEKMFSRMDSNGDGKITQEENRLGRTSWFNKLDADGNGLITAAEFKQARKVRK